MQNHKSKARLFKALMNPARLAILEVLRDGEECVCHMEAVLGYRQAYISQQLMVLREAGVVGDRRDGWNIYYHVIEPDVFKLIDIGARLTGEAIIQELVSETCSCPRCQSSEETVLREPLQVEG